MYGCSKEESSSATPSASVAAPSSQVVEESSTVEEEIVDPEEIVKAEESPEMEGCALQGQWVKAKKENKASEKNETIYWRVTGRSSDSEEVIKEYNTDSSHVYQFEDLENDALCYYVVDYEVYYPAEYTERDNGILSYILPLNAVSPDGKAYEEEGIQYVGLGNCHDLSIVPDTGSVKAGDTYKGKAIYAMLKNEPRYYFDYSYTDGENTVHSYVSLDTEESQEEIQPR